jgi:hypothetical protein
LDRIAAELGISRCDVIKVDIEGAELEFLRGGRGFLSRHRPVIFGEFNRVWMQKFGNSLAEVADLVIPWGYSLYHYVGRRGFVRLREPSVGTEHILLLPMDADARIHSALGIGFEQPS